MMDVLKIAMVPVSKAGLAAVGFGISVYVGRTLGAEAFGVYAAATTLVVVFAGIIQHVADAAYLRIRDEMAPEDENIAIRANIVLRAFGAVGSILLILIGVGAAALAGLNVPFSAAMIGLICAGVASTVLMSVPQIIHQSRQHYRHYLTLDAAMYGLRVSGLAVLTLASSFTTALAFAAHALAPALSIFASPAKMGAPASRADVQASMARMLRLGGWIGLAFVFSILTSKLDLLMLAFLSTSQEAGIYAAAINLAIIAEFAGAFLLVVFYPNILRWYRELKLRRVLSLFLLAMAPLVVITGWIGVTFAEPIITVVYGEEFSASAPIFAVLLPLTLFMLLVQPVAAPFINLRAPHILCGIEVVGLVAALIAFSMVVPTHGAIGAAWVAFTVRGCVGVSILIWALISAHPKNQTDLTVAEQLETEPQL